MATIVIVPGDVTSKRLVTGRLAARLADAGHRVVRVEAGDDHGVGFRQDIEARVCPLRAATTGSAGRLRPFAQRRAIAAAAESIDVDRFARLLGELSADLVLVDIEEHEYTLATRAARPGVPVAVLNHLFALWPTWRTPPLDSPLVPRDGFWSRVEVAGAWIASRLRLRWRDLRYHLSGRKVERTSVVRALARRLDLRDELTTRVWLHPFAPRRLPTLSLVAPDIDLPHRRPSHERVLGPMLDPADRTALDATQGTALRGFVTRAHDNGAPIVYCAWGRFVDGDPDHLVSRLTSLAHAAPDLRFVVSAPAHQLRGAPGNLFAAEALPQRALLAHAGAAIVHSGTATIHECCLARVPMVVLPFRMNDQLGNAARVAYHGIGRVRDRRTITAEEILDDLRALMSDTRMRERIDARARAIEVADAALDLGSVVDGLRGSGPGGHLNDPR